MDHRIRFTDQDGSFVFEQAENYSYLYYPLAGEQGLKSAVTPNLAGDSKINQNAFLLEPASVENLHNNKNSRNFFAVIPGKGYWSLTGTSAEAEFTKFTDAQDPSQVEAGFMWHTLRRSSAKYGLAAEITSFVPRDGISEVMLVKIRNTSEAPVTLVPIAAIPIYGRSADNLRDHRHVTSLLHRIKTCDHGVEVTPTLSFDERGHQINDLTYFVYGAEESGKLPASFYPTVEMYLGEGGSYLNPEAVRSLTRGCGAGCDFSGKEAVGALRFDEITLQPGQEKTYIVLAGIVNRNESAEELAGSLLNAESAKAELADVKAYWKSRVNISFATGDENRDGFLKWICFQPILRRIFGCSFLPYHDYGKGGRGWRDLWQDCLALLIMEPDGVRQMIIDNFAGVRIDGTNATIIGSKQGEFIADRNNITRVWMDHAYWPFGTTKLYIDETGDLDILNVPVTYFKDRQTKRGTQTDDFWTLEQGNRQKDMNGDLYTGTILEHILLQNLCAFYDVGEHNIMLLHGADWNDAVDMAAKRGESNAFTCAYSANLSGIAECLRMLRAKGQKTIQIAEEMKLLLSSDTTLFEDAEAKRQVLAAYTDSCRHSISGNVVEIDLEELEEILLAMHKWQGDFLRRNEWLPEGFFNGYYDDNGRKVEGRVGDQIRMILTGQVFAVMSGVASEDQIRSICQNADRYLYDRAAGGYRLNTDFKELKTDMGRMFGFAYGEKENGAVFSHMTVMYANALYQRGFVREGYKALMTLLETAMDFDTSKMYPGLPEYFNPDGRGMYAYLTGAASWFMMTMKNEVFGVRGNSGNLLIQPRLMKNQFDADGKATVSFFYMGKPLSVTYINAAKKDFDEYVIDKVEGIACRIKGLRQAEISREELAKLPMEETSEITVYLG